MKGVGVSRRPVRLLVAVLIALLAAGLLAAAPTNAAPPVVEHHQVLETDTTTDLNICGDLAVFKFNIRGEFTVVASDNLFHYQDNFHGTYTVTFLDPSLGVWQSRIAEAGTATVTPGGTFVNTFVANSHEGPVRIHETIFFVAGPDGTVRVDRNSVKVVGC
jgi:hypothetical protein